ncbi:PAS domain S-box-containing protein/diguanylate cyclase (GGDEF)-like protein [Nitrosospira sp. Nsp2]|uniref:EAL domain-containing protein n=1 Tax=Nitrosospira sp. Nsp2 TaxID=136548 RepID=UPI000D432A09|nr:EAL domain-containing protein [Nitrosospira sp. Nsp2]PTR17221.1 PAS domain S-box-containing protein/diguanylate cyclase (GGDEF)-like protein [Nitrosospira sp. Nsp2]
MTNKHNPETPALPLPSKEGKGQVEVRTAETVGMELLEERTAHLNRSLATLRAVIESAADGMLVTDENGNVLCYNQLYVDMWGIPRELMEAAKHPLLIQYCSNHLKKPQQFQLLTEEIYSIWPPESFDVHQLKDGRVFERFTKIKLVEGRNVGRVWSFRDVTQRKQAEAYTAQLAAIVESSYDAIIVKDLNGIITSWNAGAERIFGYRADEIIGCSIFGLIPRDRLQEESRIMSLIKSGKPVDHFETVRLAKGGKLIDVSVTISPMKDSVGNVIGASKVARDITQRKEAQERIEHLAHYDPLTGLPNRALLADRIKIAIAHADRYSHRLALLFVDLDRFKLVNDSLGHEIGDKLLKVVAERLQSSVRQIDTISRVGGDEFIVLLGQIDSPEDAARVARKIITALSQPHEIEEHELLVSASIGISIYPDSAKDASGLMRNADSSMYCAKEAGRNRYQFYSVELTSRATERLSLERDLRGAVERNEIFAVYQPQIELLTRRVIGAEALMRWRHPKRGFVPPASFIPVAEDTGLILPLGEHVLRESCLQARQWRAHCGTDLGVAVNVSAVQFRQEDFIDVVLRVLEETGLAAERLELEVTESVVMQGVESVIQKMRILNAQGIKVAIDDFGTGYSSLSYLRQFVADRLKIDQSFVRDLPEDPDAEAIVRAIVAMGRSLGLRVIAEGVETEAQARFLQGIECDEGQGYLYAKPMVVNEFEAWMAAWKMP